MPAEALERYAAQIDEARRYARRAARRGIPPDKVAAVIVKALTDPTRGPDTWSEATPWCPACWPACRSGYATG